MTNGNFTVTFMFGEYHFGGVSVSGYPPSTKFKHVITQNILN